MADLLDKLKAVFVCTPNVMLWKAENDWCFFAETLNRNGEEKTLLLAVVVPGDNYYLVKAFMGGQPLDQTQKMEDVIVAEGEVRSYQTLDKVLMVMNFLRSKLNR